MNKKRFIRMTAVAAVLAMACLFAGSSALAGGASTWASGTTNANIVFGPAIGDAALTALSALSNADGASVKLYSEGGAGKRRIMVADTNTTVTINIGTNLSNAITTGDIVVVCYSNGAVLATRVTANSTDTFTTAKAMTQAISANDYVWEVTQDFQWNLAANTALSVAGYDIYYPPTTSPMYLEVLATGSCNVGATRRADD